MNSFSPSAQITKTGERQWRAHLELAMEKRDGRTALVTARHLGPLRVQRPFYPEPDGCCHVYLLHPPGGIVIGDSLQVDSHLAENAAAVLTTPSAGRVYGAHGSSLSQRQDVNLFVKTGACLEWLPQETIVFNGANGYLHTRITLEGSAKVFGWDIVRLGRAASGESFIRGQCRQSIELWREQKPLFIERNKFIAESPLMSAQWGLQNANTVGTLFATLAVALPRETVDELVRALEENFETTSDIVSETKKSSWGLTQKGSLFIARYLGNSVSVCRNGFEFLWRQLRPQFNGKDAVRPRIWNT